jgi:hypothetical protein
VLRQQSSVKALSSGMGRPTPAIRHRQLWVSEAGLAGLTVPGPPRESTASASALKYAESAER